jgi:hypothetical protein
LQGRGGREEFRRHQVERNLHFDCAGLKRRSGHPVDDAAFLILAQRPATSFAHREESSSTVLAHARQDHAYAARAGVPGE